MPAMYIAPNDQPIESPPFPKPVAPSPDVPDEEDIRYYDPSETGQPQIGQTDRPVVAPPPSPPQNIIMRGPVSAPNTTPVQLPTQQQAANDFQMRRLSYQTADLPIDQAEAAYHAALRYQGQRQYQQDLQSGLSPSEALAKSAPLMFSNPKANVGEGAALLRAMAPRTPPVMTPYQQAELAQRKTTEARLQAESDARKNRILNPAPKNIGPTVDRIRKVETQLDQLAEDQATELAKNSQITKEQAKKIGPFGPLADSMRSDLIGLRNQVQGMKGIPQAPLDAKSRVVGKTYQTPKGPHVWTGKGWRAVPEPTETPSGQEEGSDAQ